MSESVSTDPYVRIAPSIVRPEIITTSPVPRSALTNRASPIVPPAPGIFSTDDVLTRPVAWKAGCIARAFTSQPPPGFAGTMIRR